MYIRISQYTVLDGLLFLELCQPITGEERVLDTGRRCEKSVPVTFFQPFEC